MRDRARTAAAYLPLVSLLLVRRRDASAGERYHAWVGLCAWAPFALLIAVMVVVQLLHAPTALSEDAVGTLGSLALLPPLVLGALAIVAPGIRLPVLSRLGARSAAAPDAAAHDAPPAATLADRLRCASCYVPFLPFNWIARTSTRTRPALHFHAWQGTMLHVGLVAIVSVILLPLSLWFPGPRVDLAGKVVLGTVGLLCWGCLALALIDPSIRLPLLRTFPERMIRPAATGESPRTFADHRLAGIAAALVMVFALFLIVGSSGSSIPALTLILGGLALAFGRRLSAVSAQRAMARSTKAPVVYLRSFAIDNADEGTKADATSDELVGVRDEMILAELFDEVGPVVAIGKPGERLPQLGAARAYFRNEDWQDGIKAMLARSQLTILRVGASEGFLWEVRNVVANVPPEQVVLYFSHRLDDAALRSMYTQFVARTHDIFPQALPATIGHERFVCFDHAWTPRLVGAVVATTDSWLRFVPPPFGTFLQEDLVRGRLARSLSGWFADRGLIASPSPLFSAAVIVLAAAAGGSIGLGVTLAWNAWRTSGIARALATFVTGLGVAALVAANHDAVRRGLLAIGATMPRLASAELFATLAVIGAAAAMPTAARRHLRVGGPTVSAPWFAVTIAVSAALWFACWR